MFMLQNVYTSFTNKNRYVKRKIVLELELLTMLLDRFVDQS